MVTAIKRILTEEESKHLVIPYRKFKSSKQFLPKNSDDSGNNTKQAAAPVNYKHGYEENSVKFWHVYFNK